MLRFGCAGHCFTPLAKNLEHVGFETGADVDLTDKIGIKCGDIGGDHVIDIDIVPRLFSVAVDDRALAVQ